MNAATVQSSSSLVVEPLVLRRAKWPKVATERGPSFRPVPDSWYPHIEKRGYNSSVVLPIVCCPKCSKIFFLVHTQLAAESFSKMTGASMPVTHAISHVGEVTVLGDKRGDVQCPHTGCGLHRHLYLDQWDKLRPLYCTAYVDAGTVAPVKFAYSHATTVKEAMFHFGSRRVNIVSVGRAVGFLYDEATKKISADAASKIATVMK